MWIYLLSYLCFVSVLPVIPHLQRMFSVMYSVGWVLGVAGWDPNLVYVSSTVAPVYFGSHPLGTIITP